LSHAPAVPYGVVESTARRRAPQPSPWTGPGGGVPTHVTSWITTPFGSETWK